MSLDNNSLQAATHSLQAIPFSSLIGGPLRSCIEAQAMAARTTWDFIQNVGLEIDPATGEKRAVNVSFAFMQGGRMMQLNVPLLAIIPVPYMAIHSLDIGFKANISAALSTSSEYSEGHSRGGDLNMGGGAKVGPFHLDTKFSASYSSKKDSKATSESKYCVEYTMDVAVKAGQDSMPAGLAKILELLGNSLDVSHPQGLLTVNATMLRTAANEEGDFSAKLVATYKSSNGLLMPEKITVTAVSGGEVPEITASNLVDGNLMIDLPAGEYLVIVGEAGEAGYKKIKVTVIEDAG